MAPLAFRATTPRAASQRGAELVEFALVLPVLLLVLVGIMDFGFVFQRYEVLTNAAREGARLAVLPAYSEADVQARVAAYALASGLPEAPTTTVEAVTIDVGGPTFSAMTVTAEYTYSFLFLGPIASWFGGDFGELTLTAVSTMRSEVAAAGP